MFSFGDFSGIEKLGIDRSELSKLAQSMDKLTDEKDIDKPIAKELDEVKGCPIEGNGGHWEGERGNSKWFPNRDEIPKNPLTNPDGLTWGQILDKYGIDGIEFKNGEPDFHRLLREQLKLTILPITDTEKEVILTRRVRDWQSREDAQRRKSRPG